MMTNSTRNVVVMKELEECLSVRIDACISELLGSLQRTITDSLKDSIKELLTQSSDMMV